MEFEIGNDEYVYTDGNDGMDPVEFYKFVKQGVPMKTSQITPSLFENYFENPQLLHVGAMPPPGFLMSEPAMMSAPASIGSSSAANSP